MDFQALKHNSDFVKRDLENANLNVSLQYFKTLCDEKKLSRDLIAPFYSATMLADYDLYLKSLDQWSEEAREADAIPKLLAGAVAVSIGERVYTVNMRSFATRSVSQSTEENVQQGPSDSLSEKPDISLNMIRNHYRLSTLRVEELQLAVDSKTRSVLVYDEKLVDPQALQYLRTKLGALRNEVIQSAGQLQRLLTSRRGNPFPLFLATERTDRVVRNLFDGRIVLLIEGSSWSLIGPASFFDFFKSMDDIAQLSIVGEFLVGTRFLALLITLFLPGLYVAIISFSPDIINVQLALLIAGSRVSVALPPYLEILFMMLMVEFLIEASIRLPKTISSTATTVGGLILGETAVQAGLVSTVMIIVTSSVAISNFVIPVNAMHQAIRITRYPIIIMGALFGMLGIVVASIGLVSFLCGLRSLGTTPYMVLLKRPMK